MEAAQHRCSAGTRDLQSRGSVPWAANSTDDIGLGHWSFLGYNVRLVEFSRQYYHGSIDRGYWVSFLEDAQLGPRGRWFFTQDQSGVVLSILTIRMILHSDPGEIDTASPLHVPHSIIVITHDDRRDGFSGSDQTGHGSAPDFSTTIVATSAPDSSSGSSQTAPLELGEIVEAPANIEGSANLRERIKSDSGTLDTNGYRSSAYSMTSGERFICGVCGKDFSRAHDRKRHHETQHAATPVTHKCIYCEKDFSRADSLKRHIQNGCDEAPQQ
ncbi:hypothetical protein C8R45DRAFT_1024802 [Mycena sanguinolenta]|nr:hypothetical protein C8R45DRAFT_1024802 [Mycena sanguinolenta]